MRSQSQQHANRKAQPCRVYVISFEQTTFGDIGENLKQYKSEAAQEGGTRLQHGDHNNQQIKDSTFQHVATSAAWNIKF